ncbi:hypothetical protein [Reichenbachiella agariperforans]|uniref:hypothetical protein n=1 Tax=Reichenbachiella agariperforans TaxID=156994 RepID=UPI001C09D94E|nr:hypothetical protein [Reichenbachiella agariperforans]MBU2912716.1 hypothetical protein [Reichenbachiella agariperforans]
MADHSILTGTKSGTIGGTLLTLVANVDASDLIRTCILAVVGATVSFAVSFFWKWLIRILKR